MWIRDKGRVETPLRCGAFFGESYKETHHSKGRQASNKYESNNEQSMRNVVCDSGKKYTHHMTKQRITLKKKKKIYAG